MEYRDDSSNAELSDGSGWGVIKRHMLIMVAKARSGSSICSSVFFPKKVGLGYSRIRLLDPGLDLPTRALVSYFYPFIRMYLC
jgi:hypothetical protein